MAVGRCGLYYSAVRHIVALSGLDSRWIFLTSFIICMNLHVFLCSHTSFGICFCLALSTVEDNRRRDIKQVYE